jgi:hypothetical protein
MRFVLCTLFFVGLESEVHRDLCSAVRFVLFRVNSWIVSSRGSRTYLHESPAEYAEEEQKGAARSQILI